MAADAAEEEKIHFGTRNFPVHPSSNFLTACPASIYFADMQLMCQSVCMCCRKTTRLPLAGETAT